MKVTFLIGNGFDLNLGLQTQFKEFIANKYLKNIDNESDEIIKKFKFHIKDDMIDNGNGKFDFNYWGNVELAFGNITAESKLFANGNDWQKCYDSFCDELLEYLKDESCKIQYDKVIPNFYNSIQNFYDNLFSELAVQNQKIQKQDINNCEFNFIDFNYTLILDEILKKKEDFLINNNGIGNLYHIHGDLINGLILGIDNENQIADTKIFNSLGSYSLGQFIKPQSMDMKFGNMKNIAYNTMLNSDIIIIYGCSLGDSDKTWRDGICECIHRNKMVVCTNKEELHLKENPNIGLRDFYNDIEATINDFVKKIGLSNYFVLHGYNDNYANTSDNARAHRKYIKYGHLNIFKKLKLVFDGDKI